MGINFHPHSSAEEAQERKLKQLIEAGKITSVDRTKFESLCDKFRNTCYEIRKVAGLPHFRGSYDECELTADREDLITNIRYQALYNKLNVLNLSCRHEGEKLGYRSAEWWIYCWETELAAEAHAEPLSRTVEKPKRRKRLRSERKEPQSE